MNAARLLAEGLTPGAVSGLRPGATFAGYTLIAEVGCGAMGVVFTAQQHGSNRVVAIKFAHGSRGDEARRFRTEAEAVATLDHPGILPIYEVGEAEGVAYHTMRFVEAGSLAERLDWFRDPRAAATLLARLADAVHHAHERGILHRDLKPGNILLASRTEPLVSDFGLARWLQRESEMTAPLAVLGTPDYLAPEMLLGAREGSTTAADIFSLGAIFYHLLAGRPPFAGSTVGEVLRRVEECLPAPLSRCPRDLAAVCLKCLERAPARRYPSAAALASDLRAWLEGRAVTARPISAPERVLRWARRKPLLAGLTAALLFSLTALGVNIIASRNKTLILEQRRAELAERFARDQHRTALLAQAQLQLRSPAAGRRRESLRLLREAWQLGPSPEIRSAAIAALTLLDAEEQAPPPDLRMASAALAPEVAMEVPTAILARSFHPDTSRLAAAGDDKLIYLAEASDGTILHRLRGLAGRCRALTFSPNGHWLAAAADDQTLRLWSARDGRELLVCPIPYSAEPPELRWSEDGGWLVFGPERALRIAPPAVAQFFVEEREDARAEEVRTIDLSADGRWLVTVTESGTRLWDSQTRRDVSVIAKQGAEWSSARFSPDSRRLWIGGWNSELRLVDLPTGAPQPVGKFAGALAALTEDGAWAIALSDAGRGLQFVPTSGPGRGIWLRQPHPLAIAVTRDARLAATSSYNSPGVRLWEFPAAKMIRELPAAAAALLAFTPNGATLATGAGETIQLWDTTTGARGATIATGAKIRSLDFSPDGRLLAVETRDGVLLFGNAAPFVELARLTTAAGHLPASFCFSRDSRRLAVQTATGGAVVWQIDELHRELAALGMAWDRAE